MKFKSLLAMFITTGVFSTSAALADHNSPMGAGTANMPNDIHNTRIEDDNETFLELVQQGGGTDSVNRYTDDTTSTTGSSRRTTTSSMGGSRSVSVNRGGRR